jgi:hypothetical protein
MPYVFRLSGIRDRFGALRQAMEEAYSSTRPLADTFCIADEFCRRA